MTRFSRIRRRPDHWATPHHRARARAAQRLDGPLGLAEAAWLEEHLEGCPACADVATSYAADRLALRTLRDAHPEPPRDLWARTAAAIERESVSRRTPGRSTKAARSSRVPLGALSGIAVIAVVVAASVASNGLWPAAGPAPSAANQLDTSPSSDSPEGGAEAALATPIAINAGAVKFFRTDNGVVAFRSTPIDEVCPVNGKTCATLQDGAGKRVALTAKPQSVIGSPTNQRQAVAEVDDGAGGHRLIVLALPRDPEQHDGSVTPGPTPAPSATASATASPAPVEGSPSPDPTRSAGPSGSPSPAATASAAAPSEAPSSTASLRPAASVQPLATGSPEPFESAGPTASVEPPGVDTSGESPSPEPTIAATLAIASGVEVVGESAAFSADGAWFAFTARPADESAGPDIHVWRIGDAEARRLTFDGRTVFASWDGDQVVGSRANPEDPTTASSIRIDPEDGTESPAGEAWRPMVDPASRHAVAWSGTIQPTADGSGSLPAAGQLELIPWPAARERAAGEATLVVDGPLTDYDVRWDETGQWFALWIADPEDAEIGRLSLFHVDPETDRLAELDGAPAGVPALPGFSIGEGRLAWATPRGQNGEGSRVQIVAWDGDSVGSAESAPGEDIVVVR